MNDEGVSRFERLMAAAFTLVTLVQLALGIYRASLQQASTRPALVLAAIFAAVGVLWFAKRRGWAFAFLVRPAAVLLIAIGVMSLPTAIALPVARGPVPLFAFASAVALMTADRSDRAATLAVFAFMIAATWLQIVLTGEAHFSSSLY